MIPFFFFGFFDSTAEPDEIKTSAKGTHTFIRRGFNFIKRNAETTQYVDDSLIVQPKIKPKAIEQSQPVIKYKPYSNNFINALENSHLKADAIIKQMIEKSEKIKQLKQSKNQDDEDESVLMLMLEMM